MCKRKKLESHQNTRIKQNYINAKLFRKAWFVSRKLNTKSYHYSHINHIRNDFYSDGKMTIFITIYLLYIKNSKSKKMGKHHKPLRPNLWLLCVNSNL